MRIDKGKTNLVLQNLREKKIGKIRFKLPDGINKIDSIESIIDNAKSTPIILYPGDEYSIDDKINNSESVKKYMESYMNINQINYL